MSEYEEKITQREFDLEYHHRRRGENEMIITRIEDQKNFVFRYSLFDIHEVRHYNLNVRNNQNSDYIE